MWWQPYGGSVHNWPVAVQIEENGTVRELPINNITLWAQIGTSLIIILSILLMWKIDKRQSQNRNYINNDTTL
jgi:hypothetical protein